ncbi:MAG: tetratricopeptide repeat protein [Candidatus Eremiobacteraeota bacterium]|nr:tetratricopeptide repeat protein [Candidatus Eremiobacteraeota bacterium]
MKLRPFLQVLALILVLTLVYFVVMRILYARNIIEAQRLESQGSYIEAVKLYQEALARDPGNFEIYERIGKIYLRTGDTKKAWDIFARGLALKPRDFPFLMQAGAMSFSEKNYKAAEHYFSRAASIRPQDGAVHFYLARSLHEQHKYREAEKEYQAALHAGFDRKRAAYHLAVLSEHAFREYDKALEQYRIYLASGGEGNEMALKKVQTLELWVKGQKLEDEGKFDLAVKEYESALERDPRSLEVLTRLGRAYRKNNKFPEAEKTYIRALSLYNNNYYLLNNLGSVYFTIDRLNDAESCWRDAIAAKPGAPNAHFNMAMLLEKRNKPKEAEQEYLLSLKYGYDEQSVCLALAPLYEGPLNDREKALECYRKCLSIRGPGNDEIKKRIEKLTAPGREKKAQ